MIPRTYPSTLNPATGQRQLVALFLSDVTGLQRWSDYIPVNFGKGTTLIEGSYDNNGYIAVQEITSGLGLIPFGDYVPVFFDPAATDTWQVSNLGFIPYGASGVTSAPSLDLVFTRSASLDPRITFTRTTAATRTNAAGLIEAVAIDVPRFDYDPVTLAPKGLLIEEQRTNLIKYSEQFNNAAWSKVNSSVTADVTTSPNGTINADKHIPNSGAAMGTGISQTRLSNGAVAKTAGTSYTVSCYAKAEEFNSFIIGIIDSSGNKVLNYNLSTGVARISSGTNVTASMTFVANGWYRCIATWVQGTTESQDTRFSAADSVVTTGNGTSGIYIWGAQLEAGAFATSYIPTVASQVTRAPDVAVMTGTNFSSWYNQTEGTFVVEFLPNAVASATTAQLVVMASDASTANTVELYKRANADVSTRFSINSNSVNSIFMSIGVFTQSTTKIAGAYKVNDFAAVRNAGTVVVDNLGATASVSQLNIGAYFNGTGFLNGTIANITFYPIRFSDTTLVSLSS